LLGELDRPGRVVVADLEAGLGTLSRAEGGLADVLLVLVEPSARALEVGRLAIGLARERGLPRILVIANRIRHAADLALVTEALPDEEIIPVSDDPAVLEADRVGRSPLDTAPGAPAVQALSHLARHLCLARLT
jgi:CO dehydrogenase nickel-insertion accessory protein CooC1